MRFATLAVAFAAPFLVSAAPTKVKRASDGDKTVLKFAHVLEQLESDFYTKALAKFKPQDFVDAGILVPDVAIQNFQDILDHERAHTDFLKVALDAVGEEPITGCVFNFEPVLVDVKTMATVARIVEQVGVGAYLGGSVLVDDKSVLVAAASILTIEARHQSFLNILNGANAIPQPFDIALTPSQVLALAGPFIQPGTCDLGIPANKPVTISNTDAIAPRTLLTFDLSALPEADGQQISCQMLTGNNATALSFPIEECIVPENINGPVAVFLTNDTQPLLADVVKQAASVIIAGPALIFVDSKPDALGSLARQGANPVQIVDELTPSQASELMASASATATATDSVATEPAASESVATDSLAATESAAPDATAVEANIAPTSAPLKVIGHSDIPV